MKDKQRIDMIMKAVREADPNAQLLTLEQLSAMLDAALAVHLAGLKEKLEVALKVQAPAAQVAKPAPEPEPLIERREKLKDLADIFSLSVTTLRRLIYDGGLPYNRTPGGVYLLNGEEVWHLFRAKFRVAGRKPRAARRELLGRVAEAHKAHPGKMLWTTQELARALGVAPMTITAWKDGGLAHYCFAIAGVDGVRTFRYDLQDLIPFLAGEAPEVDKDRLF